MRIAIITTDTRPLSQTGVDSAPKMGVAPEALLQGFAALESVEVHVISCLQQPVQPALTTDSNITYHTLHVRKLGWLRTLYQGCIRAVREKLQEIRPDIVHGQGTERDCAISAVCSGYPNVLTVHGNMRALARLYHARLGGYLWLTARLEAFALSRTSGVFCNSTYTEVQVAARAKRVWRVANAVRQKFLDPPSRPQMAKVPVLLNVGTVAPHKRQLELLQLARRLWERGLRFEMQFIGPLDASPPYADDFRALVAHGEKLGYARYVGPLSVDNLIAAMDAASALVHMPAEESFGLVVAEALARNLMVFTAPIGGIVDITHGVEGVFVASADDSSLLENALAQWLQRACPRPTRAAAIMRERYHPEVIARQHLTAYREALAGV